MTDKEKLEIAREALRDVMAWLAAWWGLADYPQEAYGSYFERYHDTKAAVDRARAALAQISRDGSDGKKEKAGKFPYGYIPGTNCCAQCGYSQCTCVRDGSDGEPEKQCPTGPTADEAASPGITSGPVAAPVEPDKDATIRDLRARLTKVEEACAEWRKRAEIPDSEQQLIDDLESTCESLVAERGALRARLAEVEAERNSARDRNREWLTEHLPRHAQEVEALRAENERLWELLDRCVGAWSCPNPDKHECQCRYEANPCAEHQRRAALAERKGE